MDADDQRGWHSYKCEIVTRNQGDKVEEDEGRRSVGGNPVCTVVLNMHKFQY